MGNEKAHEDYFFYFVCLPSDSCFIISHEKSHKDYSCILVPRNRKWFNHVFPKLQHLWNTVLQERETGYEHRRPKKKNKKITKSEAENIVIKVRTESFSESN